MKPSPQILNTALTYSMEFGENWLLKINDRLSQKHPELTQSELKSCDELCQKVNKMAHEYIINNPVKSGGEVTFPDFTNFESFIKTKYNWINDENLHRLYSQSCYYALK